MYFVHTGVGIKQTFQQLSSAYLQKYIYITKESMCPDSTNLILINASNKERMVVNVPASNKLVIDVCRRTN